MRFKLAFLDLARPPVVFTGSCPVREHTADGDFCGRCWFATYNNVCPRHGDVMRFLGEDPDLTDADDRRL